MTTLSPLRTAIDDRIRTRLSTLRDAFNPALQQGGDALVSFYKSFEELVTDSLNTIQEETHLMVASFVQAVNTISSAVLEVDSAGDLIHKELEKDIVRIAEVEFKKLSIHDTLSDSGITPTATSRYIELCYKWLLANLDNPYPSRKIRSQISQHTGTQDKAIDGWFVDARKRIGWNDLRKARFESRADMVKAAAQFFQPSRRPLRHTPYNRPTKDQLDRTDYSPEFASIEDRARNLYSDKFFPTALATELATKRLPSFSTPQPAPRAGAPKYADPALSYPSPERSPSSSPDRMSLPSDTTSVQNRKRKKSSIETIEPEARSESIHQPQRPLKRIRINNSQADNQDAITSLPSPVVSIQGLPKESSPSPSAVPSPLKVALSTPSQKRRRSSSDSEDEWTLHKRQRYVSGTSPERSSFSPSSPPSTSDVLPPFVTNSLSPLSQERGQLPTEGASDFPSVDPLNVLTNPLLLSTAFPLPSSSIHESALSPALSVQPALSVLTSSTSSRPSTLSTPSISAISATNSTKRKRRLSDTDDSTRAKRPHNAMVIPRHQTVSDPFPISKPADSDSFAHWWQECIRTGQEIDMAQTPVPIVMETLDESTPLDVHYENHNYYTDLASSIHEFNQWTNFAEPSTHASSPFPDPPVDQPFTAAGENMGIQDFGNVPFTSHNLAFSPSVNKSSALYPNNLPDIFDPNINMSLFSTLNLPESWGSDGFHSSPQNFENSIPQFAYDFTSTIPQVSDTDALAYADKLAKQRRVERLQEELRLAQAELAS